ncbi:MAG: 4Fe-4S dicluster domain-containing protein [Chloroflexota bacterium]|nr:4Fe-4S dicluster domain-containing protein [Chloroflexota bacterium]
MIEELRAKARELLESEITECVIGYEVGPTGRVRPAFIHEPDEVDRLVFNTRCDHNLVTYLNRRNKPRKKGEEVPTTGILVKPCDARSLQVLLNENQVQRDKVYIIGLSCPGMQNTDGTLEARCSRCSQRVPLLYDALFGEPQVSDIADTYADVEEIDALPREDRLAYWLSELDRCIRCYACRQACPACFCDVCESERDDSLWIGITDAIPEKAFFHITRAFHLAGRCGECNACEMVCPMGIPLGLLNRKIVKEIEQMMGGYHAGLSEEPTPLVTKLTGEEDIDEIH